MALGVFGIAVIGMMGALNGALQSAREVRLSQFVRTEMDNRLAQLESEKPKELERTFEVATPKITFIESIRREEITGSEQTRLGGFWRVEVLARWETDGVASEEKASFLVYSP